MAEHLRAVLDDGTEAGRLTLDDGELRFAYSTEWRDRSDNHPLSLSMPLHRVVHERSVIEPWLRNLLPDGEEQVRRLAGQVGCRSSDTFHLIEAIGDDLASAVRFVGDPSMERDQTHVPLDHAAIADRLRSLPGGGASFSVAGRWSLAGVQKKIALHRSEGGAWFDPVGNAPSTHIIKPRQRRGEFPELELNEHLTMSVLRRAGLPVASTSYERFGDIEAVVVRRFDRTLTDDGRVRRIHQEDLCQATGTDPGQKYEHDGGPGTSTIVNLFDAHGVGPHRFVNAVIANYLVANSDAHAKNHAILLTDDAPPTSAPSYDVASAWPYVFGAFAPPGHLKMFKSAMKLGGDYRLHPPPSIGRWHRVDDELQLPRDTSRLLAAELGRRILDAITDLRSEADERGRAILEAIERGVTTRVDALPRPSS